MSDVADWVAVRRSDAETVGYLDPLTPDFDRVQARSLLGHAVGEAQSYVDAEELLLDRGIGELADSWHLDGGEQALSIAELSPHGIVLRDALLSKALLPTEDIRIPWPDLDGRLSRTRPVGE
ncbi:hypothetical protein [Agromyces sp. LHK192]|uniref:hypothetical protein n=1 Tax=Agromyces sp. LHK192 TaxID=2498704 RepID=UPI000FD7B85B|nr:hypothetical protein [Agromyces sp. LHK192]